MSLKNLQNFCKSRTIWHEAGESVANIYFPNIHQNLLTSMQRAVYDAAIVFIAMHTVQRGGPAIDACARQAARENDTSCCIGTFGLSRNMYALLLTR